MLLIRRGLGPARDRLCGVADDLQMVLSRGVHVGVIALAATLVYSFVSVARDGELRRRCAPTCLLRPEYAGAERLAPSFSLPDMKGKAVSLDAYRGKVIVLNFWTKTCGPCLEEMPDLVELTHVLASRSDVAVLTVSTDDGPDEVSGILKTVLKGEPPFPILFDPDAKIVRGKYGTHLFPETWIIDKRGVIRARFDGARDWTHAAIVEYIDHLRGGGYCPVEFREGRPSGEGTKTCESLTGG